MQWNKLMNTPLISIIFLLRKLTQEWKQMSNPPQRQDQDKKKLKVY